MLRYEREAPGELLHMDTRSWGASCAQDTGDGRPARLGHGGRLGFAHVAIDDHSRAGFVQMHSDERKGSAVEFLKAAVAHYAALGVKIERLITDNGSAYRSQIFNKTCRPLGIRRLRPYRPQTNGKAERFIRLV